MSKVIMLARGHELAGCLQVIKISRVVIRPQSSTCCNISSACKDSHDCKVSCVCKAPHVRTCICLQIESADKDLAASCRAAADFIWFQTLVFALGLQEGNLSAFGESLVLLLLQSFCDCSTWSCCAVSVVGDEYSPCVSLLQAEVGFVVNCGILRIRILRIWGFSFFAVGDIPSCGWVLFRHISSGPLGLQRGVASISVTCEGSVVFLQLVAKECVFPI